VAYAPAAGVKGQSERRLQRRALGRARRDGGMKMPYFLSMAALATLRATAAGEGVAAGEEC